MRAIVTLLNLRDAESEFVQAHVSEPPGPIQPDFNAPIGVPRKTETQRHF